MKLVDDLTAISVFPGDTEMARGMRHFDWASAPLGPAEQWPLALKTVVRILLTSRQPMWVGWGPELTVLHNDACLSMLGRKHPGALGRPAAVVWPEIWDDLRPLLDTALEGNADAYDQEKLIVVRRDDHPETYHTFSRSPIASDDGTIGGVLCISADVVGACADITRQKLAEEASARLAAIVEWSDDAIVSKDLNGIITSWNRGAERVFGYRAEEVIGRSVTLLIPEDHLDEEPRILERIRRGKAVDHYETIRRRKDGRLIDISLTVSPMFDAQGRVIGASKIARDVTQRKRLEAELREADRRKDDFLATLAHELRNPLAPLRMGLDLLRAPGGVGDEVRDMMERQIGHMVRLVDELMEVSRITRGKIELRKERLDLAAVIRGAIETSRPLIDAAGHTLEFQFHDGPLNVHGDALRLSQILTNLLNNAAKYTPKGGRIWLTAQREGAEAVVRVCDSGLGIPPEMLSRVFQMFTQIDRDLQRSQGGLGIGLALVKSLVQMHGGGIEVASEGAGKGSQFTLRLPLADDGCPAEAALPDDDHRLAARPRRRVLVVDDNRDGADSLGMLLRVSGDDVRIAYDGVTALEAAAAFRPDVALLDIGMPGMSGYDLAQALRRRNDLGRLVMIAMTGWGQEDDRRRTREAGFDAHLVKPVAFSDLQALLGELS